MKLVLVNIARWVIVSTQNFTVYIFCITVFKHSGILFKKRKIS